MNIGVAFGDNIRTERLPKRKQYGDSFRNDTIRLFLLPVILIFFSLIILARLFYIQITQGSYYRFLSDSNRTKTKILHAPRGIIFDRRGTPLVYNTPGFREIVNEKTVLIAHEKANSLIAQGRQDLEVDSLRQYPFKDEISHVIGYIGQISKEELESLDFKNYRASDLVGRMGIEEVYESRLKGLDGKEMVEIDATGKQVRIIGKTDPIPGEDIILTLDEKLQKTAYSAMESVKKGAVIVSTPKGEILTLVSKPSFDPNLFTVRLGLGDYKNSSNSAYTSIDQILEDHDNQPLLNRAIGGLYPPGSTYKLITALAGLESKVIDDKFEVNDTGVLQLGQFSFASWYFTGYGKTEGMVNVVKAIKRSNDIFFYKLAEKIGVDSLADFTRKFGVHEKLGIDLSGEAKGVVPDSKWKKKAIGEQWYLGDTYHYGIGQGFLLTTPLQVNSWTQAIANGGTLYRPHLLKNQKSSASWRIKNQKFLSIKTIDLIRQGMIESCSPGGVAWPLFEFKVKNAKLKVDGRNFLEVPESTSSAHLKDYRELTIACKTGTAQHGSETTLPHSWITLFAPAYDPQVIVTVLAESSGEGSNISAPIAKKILEEWFSR